MRAFRTPVTPRMHVGRCPTQRSEPKNADARVPGDDVLADGVVVGRIMKAAAVSVGQSQRTGTPRCARPRWRRSRRVGEGNDRRFRRSTGKRTISISPPLKRKKPTGLKGQDAVGFRDRRTAEPAPGDGDLMRMLSPWLPRAAGGKRRRPTRSPRGRYGCRARARASRIRSPRRPRSS